VCVSECVCVCVCFVLSKCCTGVSVDIVQLHTHTHTHTHTHMQVYLDEFAFRRNEKFFKMKQKKTGENSVVVQRAFQVVCEAVGTFCKLRRVSAVARARAHAHTHTHTHLPQVRTGPLVRAPFPFATGN
jgi:hypothetical protein